MANPSAIRKSNSTSLQLRRNPFLSLQNELDRAMRIFGNWFEPFKFPVEHFENLDITPAIDIIDENDHFKVEAELPGMGEEDIQISVSDGLLTIRGEKTTSKKDKDKSYMIREINYGRYERHISLPDSVDIDKAKATFKKGMLWVDIPKKPGSAAKKGKALKVEKA